MLESKLGEVVGLAAILEEAREVKGKAREMMKTYLAVASDALDGFEFLTMADAGEVGPGRSSTR